MADNEDPERPRSPISKTVPSGTQDEGTQAKSAQAGPKANTNAMGTSPQSLITFDPFTFKNVNIHRITKRFRFALENKNWQVEVRDKGLYRQFPYFSFNMDSKMWYFNAAEYVAMRRNHRLVDIKGVQARFRYKNFRPFFNTGLTASLVASNQNLPLMEIWKGFKNIRPYMNFWNIGDDATSVGQYLGGYNTGLYKLIYDRLYGELNATDSTGVGAVDGVRRWYLRPTTWTPDTTISSEKNLCSYESGYNLLAHRAGCFNSGQIDAEFGWSYKPHNGLIHCAPSATEGFSPAEFIYDQSGQYNGGIVAKSNVITMFKTPSDQGVAPSYNKFESRLLPASSNETNVEGNYTAFLYEYSASVENAQWHKHGEINNISTPPDLFLGMSPQLNTDASLMLGMTEIEVETEAFVHVEDGIPLSYNFAPTGALDYDEFLQLNTHSTYDDRAITDNGLISIDSGYWVGGEKVYRDYDEPPALKRKTPTIVSTNPNKAIKKVINIE